MTVLMRKMGPFETSAVGLGCMGLSIEGKPDEATGIETIHQALDAGCRQLDTAWSYYESGGPEQTNERLVRTALDSWKGPRSEVLVATKVGHYRDFTDGRPTWAVDGRPESLIRHAKESAQALGVDTIDLLYFHRPDPKVPYQESLEAIRSLVEEGVARTAGISNADIAQIDMARSILGDDLVAVQNQFSPTFTSSFEELRHVADLGLAFVCWSPLGGFRKAKDEARYDPFRQVAGRLGVSYQQVVLAWELAQDEHVFVIPGAHRPGTILDSLQAGDLQIDREDMERLGR
ncbi:aldo/keto reductase [Bifidobacterium favimelis]|uniref:Aldo/keto reductase n=1 Tax=Bifidobacterium favimelis TaxID=3122979 RepID=A0ABU8ZMG8_9BIFI